MARSSSLLAPFVPSSRLLFRLCPGVARSLRRGRGHDLGRIRWSRPRATSTWLADCRLGLAGVVFQVRSVRAFSTCDHAELSIRAPSSSRDCVLPDCALLRHRTLIHACLPIAHTNKYRAPCSTRARIAFPSTPCGCPATTLIGTDPHLGRGSFCSTPPCGLAEPP
jgi:hypothetical protein